MVSPVLAPVMVGCSVAAPVPSLVIPPVPLVLVSASVAPAPLVPGAEGEKHAFMGTTTSKPTTVFLSIL